MRKTALAAAAAISALMTTGAFAAPLTAAPTQGAGSANIEQARLVCNDAGRCWHTRGPRYYSDDGVVIRHRYDYDRPYYRDYDRGPGIGFSFGVDPY